MTPRRRFPVVEAADEPSELARHHPGRWIWAETAAVEGPLPGATIDSDYDHSEPMRVLCFLLSLALRTRSDTAAAAETAPAASPIVP